MTLLETVTLRISTAHSYLSYLANWGSKTWFDQYSEYKANKLSWTNAMVLIHPMHYENHRDAGSVRGAREFSKEPSYSQLTCYAHLVWGYNCDLRLSTNIGIQADHAFPYSLGGPTNSDNKLYLCDLHNRYKAHDVHLYTWEFGEPSWLKATIDRVYRVKKSEEWKLGNRV